MRVALKQVQIPMARDMRYGTVRVSELVKDNLSALCADVLYWKKKGVLPDDALLLQVADRYGKEKGLTGTADALSLLCVEVEMAAMDFTARVSL